MPRHVRPVRNLVIVSDTHCGCQLGLHPPGKVVQLDNGGWYCPSSFQKKVWRLWEEFWGEWVPRVVKNEPWDFAHNGDVIDGAHHNSTTQVTQDIHDQKKIAVAVLTPIVDACKQSGGSYYHIRGTSAHVGPSSVFEEEVAEALGASPNREGQHARYDLWKRVGSGALVHLLHHVGTTSSAAHEASAVNAELTAEFVEAARWRNDPPDFVVRSHRHRYIAVDIDTARGIGAAIVTPGWQGKTPFTWKIAGARLAVPQFGGIIIRHGDEEAHYRRRVWSIARSEEE